ncbi:hypothetical protein BDZ90DRAFT_234596 [Jaminaea rosea]|uniref:L domain-like protein n=1 Tax=Jaminaea rosea TaxID=1569628 RepID=A0A316UIE4_9BASI|nr:hypothetical protein BDZ90DRAFT_234596 [Jaminaea rosea]PWN24989.1 hypothetical protein BDZ90DRAFT_234596 [Jaminaea rosea]
MASPPAYRSAEPCIASSSPSRGDLSSPLPPPSTPPPRSLSPESPSLRHQHQLRANPCSPPPNDPFSAHNKALASQHPSFGKEYPHVKHPSSTQRRNAGKRSLPVSPNLPQGATGAAAYRPSNSSSSSSSRRTAGNRRAGRGSSSHGHAGSSSSSGTDASERRRRDQVLGGFFGADSSEADAPTSDDHLDHVPWSQPGSDAEDTSAHVGLGLGQGFQEQGSPTSARRRLPLSASGTPAARQPISRSSSVNDPFGAYQAQPSGSNLFPMRDHRPSLYRNGPSGASSSPRQPVTQRRRLAGTSPKKLSTARSMGRLALDQGSSDSEDEGINAVVKREQEAAAASAAALGSSMHGRSMSQFWTSLVEKVWDSGDTVIDVSDSQIMSIHPVVADLASYVAIEPPRSFEPTTSTSSLPLPAKAEAFQRHPSMASRAPFSRTTTTLLGSGPNSPLAKTDSTSRHSFPRGTLQLFLHNNSLTRLPSALFEVGNLRVLSLRKNNLTSLPAAIGDLAQLRELNIAGNRLRWLPAEILKLRLDRFSYWPNAFVRPAQDTGEKVETRAVFSITGALLANQVDDQEDGGWPTDENPGAADENGRDDTMETDFLASQPTVRTPSNQQESTTPLSPNQGCGMMGPPPLPYRGGLYGQHLQAGPSVAGLAPPRRTFDRSRSDAQVDDLLSRGGGRMVGRANPASTPSDLPSLTASPPLGQDGDEPMPSGEAPAAPSESTAPIAGAQISRILGPLERVPGAGALPTLRELCIRRLLSPYEASEDEDDLVAHGADDSHATVMPSPSRSSPSASYRRSIVWSRVPSSSSAYQYRYHNTNGRRPTSLLESYENGALRDLEMGNQMETRTIRALEAARRTMEGKWGSRSGITGLAGASAAGGDSWCRGVAGTNRDHQVGAEGEEDGDEADASSSSSEGGAADADRKGSRMAPAPSGVMDVSSHLDTQGDDASLNPYFNRCPNPRHQETHSLSTQAGGVGSDGDFTVDYPLPPSKCPYAPIFDVAMEQRLEWVSHIAGVKVAGVDSGELIPVLWRGCKRGCLSFLDEATR